MLKQPESRIKTKPNVFQAVKAFCNAALAKGLKLIRLTIGQPAGVPPGSARAYAAECIMKKEESMHEYQDNGCLPVPDFAQRFIQAHVRTDLGEHQKQILFMPIPGIKPILPYVVYAAREGVSSGKGPLYVYHCTEPGYPTPAYVCRMLEHPDKLKHKPLETNPSNGFLFDPRAITRPGERLVMMNFPANPTGVISPREWLEEVCGWAERTGTRLFNDAAYAALAYDDAHWTLADVASKYPGLSWLEAYSASKLTNMTGWRAGAVVGSADFVADFGNVKGQLDSGFNAALALGALYMLEHDRRSVDDRKEVYRRRAELLIQTLTGQGMRLAAVPKAGFFTLWLCPNRAFGQAVKSAEHFNALMIENSGLAGVHFEPYIRYTVCGDIEAMATDIEAAFAAAAVEYD